MLCVPRQEAGDTQLTHLSTRTITPPAILGLALACGVHARSRAGKADGEEPMGARSFS